MNLNDVLLTYGVLGLTYTWVRVNRTFFSVLGALFKAVHDKCCENHTKHAAVAAKKHGKSSKGL